MQNHRGSVAAVLTWMAGITSVAVTLLPPLGFFLAEYGALAESLSVETRMEAVIVSRIVARNPRVWRYESERLKEGLQEFRNPNRSIHIVDMEGRELAELGDHFAVPAIAREAAFFDYGVAAGRIVSETSLLPLLKAMGIISIISCMLGFVVFVPLRRIPLRALQRSNEALASTNREYRTLVAGLAEGLMLLDDAGVVIAANASAARILCLPPDALAGKPITELLSCAAREDGSPFDGPAWGHLSGRTQAAYSERLRVRPVAGDGRTTWVLMRSRLASVPGEVPIRFAVSLEDITGGKRLEELKDVNAQLEHRIQERTSRLEQATRELETFGYVISHDLRSPLTYIGHLCDALKWKHGLEHDVAAKECFDIIDSETRRMSRLIDDLLSLAQVGRQELEFVQVDLSALAWQVIDRLSAAVSSRSIKLDIADGLRARADAAMMRTMLHDLFANAWKFTEGTVSPRIGFGARRDGDETIYFVRDNGAGFDQSFAGKLFVPFQRLHDEVEFRGAGIGLARARRIIERHNGRIWAEGQAGAGATFFFTLNVPADGRQPSA